jgi:hypothetical protein
MELTAIDEIRALYGRAMSRGWGGLTSHAVIRLLEEAAGVELRSSIFQALAPHVEPQPGDSAEE